MTEEEKRLEKHQTLETRPRNKEKQRSRRGKRDILFFERFSLNYFKGEFFSLKREKEQNTFAIIAHQTSSQNT